MSDPTAEPGVPVENQADSIPPAGEKSVAKEVEKRAPPRLLEIAKVPDSILLRLSKLLAAPGGPSTFLSTFNYTLYLLVYLESKTLPLQNRLLQRLGKAGHATTASPGPSPIAALATLLSSTRTTLRLLGLPPLYAWLRQLLQGPKPGQDKVLYATAVTQCTLYMIFQAMENIALLTDHKVLSPALTAPFNRSGKTAPVYLWSYRAWFAGVMCDFVRLGREAQLERQKRARRSEGEKQAVGVLEEDQKADAKFWADAVTSLSWFPMAVNFAFENGVPGFNLGIMGLSGGIAGIGKFAKMWEATKQ